MVLTPVKNHKIFAPEPEEKKNTPPPSPPPKRVKVCSINYEFYPTPFFVQDLTVIYDTNLNGYKINNTL